MIAWFGPVAAPSTVILSRVPPYNFFPLSQQAPEAINDTGIIGPDHESDRLVGCDSLPGILAASPSRQQR